MASDFGLLLLKVDIDSAPAGILLLAVKSLVERIIPVNAANQAFLNTILPVMEGIPHAGIRQALREAAHLGVQMELLGRAVMSTVDVPRAEDEERVRKLAYSARGWSLLGMAMAEKTQGIKAILQDIAIK